MYNGKQIGIKEGWKLELFELKGNLFDPERIGTRLANTRTYDITPHSTHVFQNK